MEVIRTINQKAAESLCGGRIKKLAYALSNYRELFGCLPPAYIADQEGQALYSWRVLVLPFCELEEVYQRFEFTESWDSTHNAQLLNTSDRDLLNSVFSCPSYANPARARATYLAVVGNGTAWPGLRPSINADVNVETVLLVEVQDSEICWSEPRDLSLPDLRADVSVDCSKRQSDSHKHRPHYVTTAGNVRGFDRLASIEASELIGHADVNDGVRARLSEEERKKTIARLERCLKSTYLVQRHGAALLLGQVGPIGHSARQALTEALNDSDGLVSKAAAMSLSKISHQER